MVKSFASYRQRSGLALLVLLTAYAVMDLLWQGLRSCPEIPKTDPVTIHEARIEQLKPFLPASGAVGYVTTVENDRIFATEKAIQNVEYLAQYALTQYTLAPLIVRNSPDLPLVIGNFLDGPRRPGFVEAHRSDSPQGFRRGSRPVSAGEKTLIILALASLLIAFVSGLLLTFFLAPSLKNSAAGRASDSVPAAASASASPRVSISSRFSPASPGTSRPSTWGCASFSGPSVSSGSSGAARRALLQPPRTRKRSRFISCLRGFCRSN